MSETTDLSEEVNDLKKAYRHVWKKIVLWGSLAAAAIAVVAGIYFLWKGITIGATIADLLWELAIVFAAGVAGMICIVMLIEGRTRVQKVVMPGADENHSLLDWIGRVVGSRSEKRNPLTDVSPLLQTIEDDHTSIAIMVGLGMIASSIRALGRYILMAMMFMAIAWSLAPFAASLAP